MIGAIEGLCTIAGDALVAIGTTLRTRREGFSDYEAGDYLLGSGRMESDGPDTAAPVDYRVRALAELPDSELIRIAATIIAGWKPLLLETTSAVTLGADVDVLVEALRDRAAQFAAIEVDAPAPLGAHLTDSARTRSE